MARLGSSAHARLIFLVSLLVSGCQVEGREINDVRRIVASEDLRIGEVEGAPEVTFGRIGSVVGDTRGRILVLDILANEVRVFRPDGSFAYAFGREGGGPGELRGPCCAAFGPGGLFWIRDSGNRRYGAFSVGDSTAEPRGQIRMAHGDHGRLVPTSFDADGSLVDVGSGVDSAGNRASTVRYSIALDGRSTRKLVVPEPPADSLSTHELRVGESGGGFSTFFFHQPFGPQHEVAHGPGGQWADAVTSRYAVAWRGPDGELLRTIDRDLAGPELSAAEGVRADSSLARDARRAGGRLPYGVPERKPPIRDLYFDQTGRLWVERWVVEGAAREADVWSADGVLLFTLEWPSDVRLSEGWRGERQALGIARDQLGVERVVRIRWE